MTEGPAGQGRGAGSGQRDQTSIHGPAAPVAKERTLAQPLHRRGKHADPGLPPNLLKKPLDIIVPHHRKDRPTGQEGKLLSDDGDMLWVQAEHMPGDHWWVAVSSVRFHEAEADFDEYRKSSPGRKSAAAIARIAGSAGLLLVWCNQSWSHACRGEALSGFSTFDEIEPGPPASQSLAGGPGPGNPRLADAGIPIKGGEIHVIRHP